MISLLLSLAWADCAITLVAPSNNSAVSQSPQFRWLGNCSTYRLRISPSGGFATSDTYNTPWRSPTSFKMEEANWDTYQAGTWAAGFYFKVQGRDSASALFESTTWFVSMDPNLDNDAYSVAAGDCNDGNATIYPGATEVCNDGVDNNCDGASTGCGLTGLIDLSAADAIFAGEAAADSMGTDVTFLPDLDGDGYDDLALGAPYNDGVGSSAGEAYVYFGPSVGGSPDATVSGLAASDGLGASLSPPGDTNGDGYGDLLVAIDAYEGSSGAPGTVYIFTSAPSGSVAASTAQAWITGENTGDELGFSMTAACDVNGDNYDDVLMGGPDSDPNGRLSGGAWLLHGPLSGGYSASAANAEFFGEAAEDTAGHAVTCAGDMNGDGYDDVVIGGDENDGGGTDAGAAYLFLGPVSGTYTLSSASADAKFIGEDAGDGAGIALSGGSDLTGDGLDDLVITAPLAETSPGSNTGITYVVTWTSGGGIDLSTAQVKVTGAANNDQSGTFSGTMGDVNADGADDLLLGARRSDLGGTDSGAGYLLYGPLSAAAYSLSTASVRFAGEDASDFAGWSGSIAGDFNGDGADDVLLGAPANSTATATGKSYLVFGESD